MQQHRKTIFISDLHLQQKQAHITKLFLYFLQDCIAKIDALYILGDLFEAWIGDDDQSVFNNEIIAALQQATARGLTIYLLHGNRDFLLGKKFLRDTGCILLREEESISLYGTPTLLMHGDLLCTLDVKYLKARKIMRRPFLLTLFLCLPLYIRRQIANRLRTKSTKYTAVTNPEKMDVTQDAVRDYLQKHNVLHLIHGHTHKPAIHETTIADKQAQRIVLGAWHECGNYLVWHGDGSKELVEFGMGEMGL